MKEYWAKIDDFFDRGCPDCRNKNFIEIPREDERLNVVFKCSFCNSEFTSFMTGIERWNETEKLIDNKFIVNPDTHCEDFEIWAKKVFRQNMMLRKIIYENSGEISHVYYYDRITMYSNRKNIKPYKHLGLYNNSQGHCAFYPHGGEVTGSTQWFAVFKNENHTAEELRKTKMENTEENIVFNNAIDGMEIG